MRTVGFPVLITTVMCTATLCAGGQQNSDSTWPESDILLGKQADIPTVWKRVAKAESVETLQFLADQTRGNYERIRTWKGTYQVYTMQHASVDPGLFATTQQVTGTSPIVRQEFRYTARFILDASRNSVYWQKTTQAMHFFESDTDKVLSVKNVSPSDGTFVVTPEHFLEFSPNTRWPAFATLPSPRQAGGNRAAFRRSTDVLPPNSELLFDPRLLFGFSHVLRFWTELDLYLAAASGKSGPQQETLVEKRLAIYKSEGSDGTWYRLVTELDTPDRNGSFYALDTWSPVSGYNPVRRVMADGEDGRGVQSTIEWKWERMDGIFVPKIYREVGLLRRGMQQGERAPVFVKELVLKNSTLNPPVAANQFDYVGLGLTDGDLVVDRIENSVKVMRQGVLHELPKHARKPSRLIGTWRWWLVISVTAGLLTFGASLLMARRSEKKKNEDSST